MTPLKKLLTLFLIVFSFSAHAAERILSYRADITVQPDASLFVTENITVTVEGVNIRRGIYRDLPRNNGERYHIESVFRNGNPEPFFIENSSGNLRVNTGNDDFIPRETTTFTLVYRVQNAVRFLNKYDEVYWNVTGNNWVFPIDEASASVTLPRGARVVRQAGYIGGYGSTESARYSDLRFFAPRPLQAGEGLTVAVGFDKGAVSVSASPHPFNVWAAIGVLGLYFLLTGLAVKRNPPSDSIMPRFDGITGMTPAEANFAASLGAKKDKTLALALLQATVSGYCSFDPQSPNTLLKNRAPKNDEERILDKFLTFPLHVGRFYNPRAAQAQNALNKLLREKTRDCFKTNKIFTVSGALLAAFLLIKGAYDEQMTDLLIYFAFYLPFFIVASTMALQNFKNRKFSFATVFMVVFISFHFATMMLAKMNGFPAIAAFYAAAAATVPIYGALIKRLTEKGRDIADHIQGIRLFLKSSAQISAEKTEKLMPYAVLLDMESEWSDKIKAMSSETTAAYCRHIPCCGYDGFVAAVGRSTTAPARSSGSGGGGFSGGGHGGGGGGGR